MLDSDCCGACVGVRLLIRDDMLFGYPLSFVLTPPFPLLVAGIATSSGKAKA